MTIFVSEKQKAIEVSSVYLFFCILDRGEQQFAPIFYLCSLSPIAKITILSELGKEKKTKKLIANSLELIAYSSIKFFEPKLALINYSQLRNTQ